MKAGDKVTIISLKNSANSNLSIKSLLDLTFDKTYEIRSIGNNLASIIYDEDDIPIRIHIADLKLVESGVKLCTAGNVECEVCSFVPSHWTQCPIPNEQKIVDKEITIQFTEEELNLIYSYYDDGAVFGLQYDERYIIDCPTLREKIEAAHKEWESR